MHMPKRFLGLFFLCWLTACQAQPTATPTVPLPPTVSPAAGGVSFMVFGEPAELQAYQTLVEAYAQKYPDQHIELIHIPGQSDYRKRLAADFAAGAPANVVLLNYRRYAIFADQGLLTPLDPYLAQSPAIDLADFYAEAVQPFYWRRQLFCLPQNISSPVVYYNRDLFAAAGQAEPADTWTWDDFVTVAKNLTHDLDGDGRSDQYGLGVEPTLQRLAPFIWQSGGALVDNGVYPLRLALEEPKTQAALEWFIALQVKHHVVPDAEAEAAEASESRFLNGRLAMFIDSRRVTPTFRTITTFDWDVAPLPSHRGRQVSVLHADGYCLTSATADKAAAWQFIEFANSVEGQTLVAASGRTVPSRKAVAVSPAFLDPAAKPARSQVFLDAIPHLRPVPVLTHWADIESLSDAEIERAFYGQATGAEIVLAVGSTTDEYFKK